MFTPGTPRTLSCRPNISQAGAKRRATLFSGVMT